MDEPTPTTNREYQPTPATAVPLNRVENLPPEPEPRIKDPASTISVNTATSFGGTTPLGPGSGRTMKQVIDLAKETEKSRAAFKKEDDVFINLGSPLNIKTKHGELQAGPGDVVMRIAGGQVIFSQDAFEQLGEIDLSDLNYDEILRKTLKRGVIARRLDDGNRIPMTPEQEAEADANIEEEVANTRRDRDAERARKQKLVDSFRGKEGEAPVQIWNAVDSSEGPPTATPSETATLVPVAIPIEVIEEPVEPEVPPPTGVDATGATAGSPGSFTPSGATAPADLAGLNAITADPMTPWTEGQHVVLGDSSQAYWDGTTWLAGSAPAGGVTGFKLPPNPVFK